MNAPYDSECYPNYWLLKLRPIGGSVRSWSLRAGQSFDGAQIAEIYAAMDAYTVISFNGNYYDVPMICAALSGYSCEQLKWLNNQIIEEKRKPWELGLPEWKPRDHIDIMEVLPGAGSQKTYAGRIHCKQMRDLPYEPDRYLSEPEIAEVDSYCENDLDVLETLFVAVAPLIKMREELSKRYGIDLRSKSDAQLAEAVIKHRCEQALNRRLYKNEIDWNLKFRYEPPEWLAFHTPELQQTLTMIRCAIFHLGPSGAVTMPAGLDGLDIKIGTAKYRLGIGGLHSSESCVAHVSDEIYTLRDIDVASYYPSLILNSGRYPGALGHEFLKTYATIKEERLTAKRLEKKLVKDTPEWMDARVANEGGKIFLNGCFGKTGSPYSILFAPEMLIQTTITGQLALLMLIEWHEHYGMQVVSANTDGMVIKCRRDQISMSDALVKEWEKRTGLEMEASEYKAIYSQNVNNYVAVKMSGEVKRKGVYSQAGLIEKKNPDVEICGDAVAALLSEGIPILYTISACRDIRKFVTIQKVAGGAVKLWGEGPRKDRKVRDMDATLLANGWVKEGRKWTRGGVGPLTDYNQNMTNAREAYISCFRPQRPEYLGKVIRWFYSTNSPGPIIYNSNGNQVGLSYGAKPCMTLPDEFPDDIDYEWYLATTEGMLKDMGYYG